MTSTRTRRLAVIAAAIIAAVAVAGPAAGTPPAAADASVPPGRLFTNAHWDITGTANIQSKNAKFAVPLGPTRLTTNIDSHNDTGEELGFDGVLPFPAKTITFKAFGYLPVRATMSFTQVGPVDGFEASSESVYFAMRVRYTVSLSNVIVGYSKANVGATCKTLQPMTIKVTSTTMDIFGEGDPVGALDLGAFGGCSTSTELINLIFPSTGNPTKLHFGALDLGERPDRRDGAA